MAEWKTVRIGNVLQESKVLDLNSSAEKRISVRLNLKGVEKRPVKAEKEGATKYYKRRAGQFIYGKQNIHKGAFGVIPSDLDGFTSSLDLPAFDVDNTTSAEWICLCLKLDNRYEQLIKDVKGVGSQRLSVEKFLDLEIPFTEKKQQDCIIKKIQKNEASIYAVLEEIAKQKDILKQLRQSVLQDAIEGKLTENWRKKHPVIKGDINYDAEALYNLIQQERQKLIAAGKIKKEKPLPEIKVEEMSLHVPNNWLYVRLGDVAEGFQYGTASKSESEGKCPVLRMGNVQNGIVDWEKLVYTNDDDEIEKYKLTRDDLIFNRTNSREWVGKTCIYNSDRQAIYAGYLVRFRVLSQNAYFANYVLNSKYHREWCNEVKTDALGQSNINAEKLKNFIFPIAPLAEQNEIVSRVESCLKKIDELELQIATRETYAKTLLQTTLHTTFQEG